MSNWVLSITHTKLQTTKNIRMRGMNWISHIHLDKEEGKEKLCKFDLEAMNFMSFYASTADGKVVQCFLIGIIFFPSFGISL